MNTYTGTPHAPLCTCSLCMPAMTIGGAVIKDRVRGKAALLVDLMVDKLFKEYTHTLEDMTPRQLATVAMMRGVIAGMESAQKALEGKE